MTWADNLLPASFRGIEFDVLSIDDEARRSLARHSYPFTDGTDIEDMGRDARPTSVKAVFYGPGYEARLKEFTEVLDIRGAGPFIHPVFGYVEHAQVSSYRISHDADRPDCCYVSIEFEESGTTTPFFDRPQASQAADAVDDAADALEDAAAGVLEAQCGLLNGAAASGEMDALSRVGALRQQAVSFLLTLNAEVRGVITSITDPIGNVLGFVSDVTALSQSLIDAVPRELEFLQNRARSARNGVKRLLPASSWETSQGAHSAPDTAAVATAAFTRIDKVLSSTALLPIVASATHAPGSYSAWAAANAASGAPSQDAGAAIPPSSSYPVAAPLSAADTAVLQVHISLVRTAMHARVAAMVMGSEAAYPQATPRQLEHIVTTVRSTANEAMEQARQRYTVEHARAITEPLKTLALAVQEAGRTTINARPPLTVRAVESQAPLRLLAHLWYGSHARALELQRLNNFKRPNDIGVGDRINAYAK